MVLGLACILTKKSMCSQLDGHWEGEPVGGGLGRGVGGAGRLEGLCCSVGDASRRWSHMCRSLYLPRFLLRVGS